MAERFDPGELFKVEEIADKAKVSENTIRRAIANSEIAVTRLGKLIRISEASYRDWIRRNTEKVQL